MAFIVRNITAGTVTIDEIGQDVPASQSIDLEDLYGPDVVVAGSAEIKTLILADDLRIVDGVTELNQTDSIAYVNAYVQNVAGTGPLYRGNPLMDFVPQAVDGFRRLRTSQPASKFDWKFIEPSLFDLFWDESQVSGSGTSGADQVNRAARVLSVSASTAGKRVLQTRRRFNYQSGKSAMLLQSVESLATTAGITIEVGQFDDDNGTFLRSSGGTLSYVIRSKATGSVVDTVINQSLWGIDPLDGNGPSGITLDPSKVQLMYRDLEWLGVGAVTNGFVFNRDVYLTNSKNHTNVNTAVYMSNPNLPLRYSIENDGTGAATSLGVICATVISEGGEQELGVKRVASRGFSAFLATGGNDKWYPIVSIRSEAGSNVEVDILSASIMCSTNVNFEVGLFFNPDITGTDAASWSTLNKSSVQMDTSRTQANFLVENGNLVQLESEYTTDQVDQISFTAKNPLKPGFAIDGTPDEFVLAVKILNGNANEDFYGSITFREKI